MPLLHAMGSPVGAGDDGKGAGHDEAMVMKCWRERNNRE